MGLLLDGNSWITSSPTNYVRPATDHTIMYWVRLDDNTAVRRPMGATGLWEARTGAGSNVLTSDYLQSGTLGTVTLTLGTYHHVAFVQSVSTSQRFAYLDGVLVNTINSATFSTQQTGVMSIGVSPGGAGQGWFGAIDDMRIYDRVMPTPEIETIYACRGTDDITFSLSHWYPMCEGNDGKFVTKVTDVMGGLDCTVVTGTPFYNCDAGIKTRRMV